MEQRREKSSNNSAQAMYLILIGLFLFLTLALIIKGCAGSPAPEANQGGTALQATTPPLPTDSTEPEQAEKAHVVASASIGVTGDIMGHGPVLESVLNSNGEYDFTECFQYIAPYFSSYDYMIANLEVTLGGPEAGAYKGYPTFNCPDSMIDALKEAGVDMVTTATNHSYDTGHDGFIRTQEVLNEKGMDYSGTRLSEEDPIYQIRDINGIKVGMISYTYEAEGSTGTRKDLNGIKMEEADGALINSFNYSKMQAFYTEVETAVAAMESEGADFIMFFIHWGNEYETSPSNTQKKIAQNLCDRGVDVIVGGHPHVVQPMQVLSSETGQITYCIYSTGNCISNQRRYEITSSPNGHTEDGLIFNVEFSKWSDGSLTISNLNVTPLWVDLSKDGDEATYTVLPVDITYRSIPAISKFADTVNAIIDPYRPATQYEMYVPSDPTQITSSFNRTSQNILGSLNECRKALGLEPMTNTAGN